MKTWVFFLTALAIISTSETKIPTPKLFQALQIFNRHNWVVKNVIQNHTYNVLRRIQNLFHGISRQDGLLISVGVSLAKIRNHCEIHFDLDYISRGWFLWLF